MDYTELRMARPTRLNALPRAASLALLLVGTSVVAACQRPSPASTDGSTASPAAASTGSGAGAERALANAETLGQVGPGAGSGELIEVTDLDPASPSIFFTAGLLGYTEPCGCTIDLVLGGIDRVTGFIQTARALATDSLMLDAGNVLFEHESISEQALAQEVRKTQVLMAAHRELGTFATVPGPMDLANGLDFYLQTIPTSGMNITVANLQGQGGIPIGLPHLTRTLGSETVGIIGAVDPALFDGVRAVVASDALPAIELALTELEAAGATTTILLWQGDLTAARAQLESVQGLDFIIVGNHPRRTDEVTRVGSAFVLEAYDQGRTIGRLKLVSHDTTSEWANARSGSNEEIARIDRLIASIEERIAQLPPGPDGQEPEIVTRQRERLAELQAQKAEMQDSSISFAESGRSFYFTPVDMGPGTPVNDTLTAEMISYNEALRTINMASITAPIPAAEGQPHYVGNAECSRCHVEEQEFWLTTNHAHAIDTLELRNKDFDRNCVGCHVTGWEQPGGSVLGHTEGLENVQCEQCHGPGSMHVQNPMLNNVPTGVHTEVPESTCASCHNEEHSPRFDYATYMARILGPGHGAPAAR
jgi:hypothetical protein